MSSGEISYRQLPVRLTKKELQEISKETSSFIIELEAVRDEKKSVTAVFNKKITSLQDQIEKLAHKTESEVEDREVQCKWFLNEIGTQVELVRQDNGEIIETREPEPEDHQTNILEQDRTQPEDAEITEPSPDDIAPDDVDPEQAESDQIDREIDEQLSDEALTEEEDVITVGDVEQTSRD